MSKNRPPPQYFPHTELPGIDIKSDLLNYQMLSEQGIWTRARWYPGAWCPVTLQ